MHHVSQTLAWLMYSKLSSGSHKHMQGRSNTASVEAPELLPKCMFESDLRRQTRNDWISFIQFHFLWNTTVASIYSGTTSAVRSYFVFLSCLFFVESEPSHGCARTGWFLCFFRCHHFSTAIHLCVCCQATPDTLGMRSECRSCRGASTLFCTLHRRF